YWSYRAPPDPRCIKGIIPTFEAHILTPLNHRGSADTGHVPDWVSLTGGVNLVFGRASTVGFALGAPVTGPRPYNMEAIAAVNFRFLKGRRQRSEGRQKRGGGGVGAGGGRGRPPGVGYNTVSAQEASFTPPRR